MSSSDVIATIAAALSALSLIVSLWAAYKAAKLTDHQFRLSSRAELHKMLLEIDRELLHDQSLYPIFKSSPISETQSTSQVDVGKRQVYVTMYLNLFELSFAQFKEIKRLTSAEEEVSKAWDAFIVSFFKDCTLAKAVWAVYRETYYSSFREYIDRLISETDDGEESLLSETRMVTQLHNRSADD